MNTDVVVIPGGMTSQLQMLDVVNRPFSDNVKQLYNVSGSWEGTMVLTQLEEQEAQCLLFVSGS